MMNYENDMIIDETALDVEWVEQSGLMFRYAKHAADCRLVVDQVKERLELTKAKLDKEIRTNPENYGIEKLTETVVSNTIITQDSYKKENEALMNAQFELNVANGDVRAMEARKDALENLGRLLGLQYFAGPRLPRDITEEKEKRRAKLNGSIGAKIRERKK